MTEQQKVAMVEEKIHQPLILATSNGTVVVHGYDFLPKLDMSIIETLMGMPELSDHKNVVKLITFRDDDKPKGADGNAVFANCCPEMSGIVVNLIHTFDESLKMAIKETGSSMYAVFYRNMILNILHEYKHLVSENFEGGKMKEAEIETWAEKTLAEFGKRYTIDLPYWKEHPFFSIVWEMTAEDSAEKNDKIAYQKHLIDNNILYELPGDKEGEPAKICIMDFRGYLHLWSQDDLDDPTWTKAMPTSLFKQTVTINDLASAPTQVPVTPQPTHTQTPLPTYAPATVQEHESYIDMSMVDGVDGVDYNSVYGRGGGQILTDPEGIDSVDINAPNAVIIDPTGNMMAPGVAPQEVYASSGGTPYGNFPVAGSGQAGPVATYQDHGMTDDQVGAIAIGLYMKLYNHIFSTCRRFLNSDMSFEYPEGVHKQVALSPEENTILTTMNCQDANGRLCKDMPVQGWIAGRIYTNGKLPAYEFVMIGQGGKRKARKIIPQNAGKRYNDGRYSPNALLARAGDCIAYIFDMDDHRTNAGPIGKIHNGAYTPIAPKS